MLPKVEPHADQRAIGAEIMQMFTAFKDEGFTEQQAMELLKAWIHAMVQAGGKGSQ